MTYHDPHGPAGSSGGAGQILSEMREFAGFAAGTQRYIRRSLDVGLARRDAFRLWARDGVEAASIRTQTILYQDLAVLRRMLPEGPGPSGLEPFVGKLVRLSAFDLGQDHLESFSAYRFLYERLAGAAVRPWLPAAFCAAAALPQIEPARRKALLQSISEAAATAPGWSTRPPRFFPEFVEMEAA
ncbi:MULTISPECIES: hypothetical protein [Novosphingobium]|uniref:hypothetical protein n=1 Tax=Novosphingobium TaxID=165696 RepID=UPI001CD2B10C|nr:hypothetical protein [Novosphingobium percolationis]MCH7629593.1 hypothetical protein [Pseudomonadota bacterium]